MLGMFHLLPLLKGWEYKIHRINTTALVRGAPPIEVPISERGWLLGIMFITNDCYATLRIQYQGADLQMVDAAISTESAATIGAFMQDPGGWIERYTRPNPYSTAGIFCNLVCSGGFQGAALPYIPTLKASAYLPLESTQASTIFGAVAHTVAITDIKTLIKSLRSVLAIKDYEIDPSIFTLGPAEFKEFQK